MKTTFRFVADARIRSRPDRLTLIPALALFFAFTLRLMGTAAADEPGNTNAAVLDGIFAEVQAKESAWTVHQRTSKLTAVARFQVLSDWVLPNDSHAALRLQVDYTPTHPAGSDQTDMGGELISPALDLIEAAEVTGQLHNLYAQVNAIVGHSPLQQKNQLALQAIILIRQGRIKEALDRVDEFLPLSAAAQPDNIEYRSAEAALYWVGREVPEVHETLVDAVGAIAERKKQKNVWPIWNRLFQSLVGEAYFRDTESKLNSSASGQWTSAGGVTAESRGGGVPSSRWQLRNGRAVNTISHDHDLLYFQSPLRGNFQVECDVDTFGWRESEVMVAGKWVALVYTRATYDVGDVRGNWRNLPLAPQLERVRDRIHYRVVVRDSTAITYAMGRPLHRLSLTSDHDPWVAIRNNFKHGGAAYNVRVTGNPVIPDEIYLSTDAQLESWQSYNGGHVALPDSHWRSLDVELYEKSVSDGVKNGGGIFASLDTELPEGCFHEETLFYHRPMLEDGTIEYEFFYQEGKSAAHPAMDRMCFLIQPDGVKLHWLTDGIYDRTDLAPDNVQRLGPALTSLKDKAWNKLRLTLVGDDLQVVLNDEVVVQQTLNIHNQRRFGLFHYADLSELRVRNVRWKGEWPKKLPAVAEQDLADDDGDFLDRNVEHLKDVFEHDFVRQGATNDRIKIVRGAAGAHIRDTPSGVLAFRPNDGGYRNSTIAPGIRVEGDFDIIVRYEDFQYQTSVKGNASLMLIALLENSTSDEFFVTRRHMHDAEGEHNIVQCATVQRKAEGEKRDYFVTEAMEERSGRLRLARRADQVYWLTAEGDSPNFQLRGKRPFSKAPIKLDGIRLVNQMHGKGQSSVLWKDIVVRAENLGGGRSAEADQRVVKLNEERSTLPRHVLHDFTKSLPSPLAIYRWGDTQPPDAKRQGLTIVAPGFDTWESSGGSTRQPIEGDFDISMDFQVVRLDKPSPDEQTALYLQLELQDQGRTQISSLFEQTESGHREAMSQIRQAKRGGGYNYRNEGAITMKNVNSLRIARRGKRFTILARSADDAQDRILNVTELSDAVISLARLMLHTGGAGRDSEVLVTRLEVHADAYQPVPTMPAPVLREPGFLDSLLDVFE